MKIADPESIKSGEQDLINSIMDKLNPEIIESIAAGKLVIDNMEFRKGDMIIHKNRIVYKMDFQTSLALSVMFDRDGNLITEEDDPPLDLAPDDPIGTEEEGEQDDDFNSVLQKNRDFWHERTLAEE